jgi:hypothetical protein
MQNRNQRILGLIAFAVLSSTTIISVSALQRLNMFAWLLGTMESYSYMMKREACI